MEIPVLIHPSLLAILLRLQLVHDYWDLLNNQKEYYLPLREREPDSHTAGILMQPCHQGYFVMHY